MSGPLDRDDLVKQWIDKAENDLITAEHTLTMTERCPFDTVSFHAHQCAEKYLKALLVHHSVQFPKTHDLRLLIQMIENVEKLKIDLSRTLSLNRYAIETRYPDNFEPIEREEAEKAVAIAKEIKQAVEVLLPRHIL